MSNYKKIEYLHNFLQEVEKDAISSHHFTSAEVSHAISSLEDVRDDYLGHDGRDLSKYVAHANAMFEVLEMIEEWRNGDDNEFHTVALELLERIRNVSS
jgi:hypothetical protein